MSFPYLATKVVQMDSKKVELAVELGRTKAFLPPLQSVKLRG